MKKFPRLIECRITAAYGQFLAVVEFAPGKRVEALAWPERTAISRATRLAMQAQAAQVDA